ncbi:MFS transporter, partial [Acinetobacter baumannii]|nr:MFS transporter [Acinetobacter baumannii]
IMTEFAPKKLRSTLVSLMFSGYAIGGMSSALLGMWLVPKFGWQIMFILAGIPLISLPIIWKFLLESIDYLLRHKQWNEVRHLLQHFAPGKILTDHTGIVLHQENQQTATRPLVALFTENRALVTVFLWLSVFMALLMVYALGNWIPKLMVEAGYDLSTSLVFLLALNLGGMLG